MHDENNKKSRMGRRWGGQIFTSFDLDLRLPNKLVRAADIQRGWVVIASKWVFDLIFLDQFNRPAFICFDPI
jgi:hypothetical protein